MDPVAAKFLGAGLACLGMGLAAMGVGNIFGNFVAGALRNPSAAAGMTEEEAFAAICPGLLPGCTTANGCCAAFRTFSLSKPPPPPKLGPVNS